MVPVGTVHVQGIAAATAGGGVKFQPKIVPAEEPIESALGLLVPPGIRGGPIRFQAGGHHCLRLDGLLVEGSADAATAIKAVITNGPEVAVFRGLDFREPAQGLQALLKHGWLSSGTPAKKQGVRQLGIVVSKLLLEPTPVRLRTLVEKLHEPAGEGFPNLASHAVSTQSPEIFVNANEAERPCARRSEFGRGRQCLREELSGHHLETPIG